MRPRPAGLKLKPTAAPRSRMAARLASNCAGVPPYLRARCSLISSPPGGMSGFSSKGWKCSVACTASALCASARCSEARPTAHQGQAMSETKSILRGVVMGVLGAWSGDRIPDAEDAKDSQRTQKKPVFLDVPLRPLRNLCVLCVRLLCWRHADDSARSSAASKASGASNCTQWPAPSISCMPRKAGAAAAKASSSWWMYWR